MLFDRSLSLGPSCETKLNVIRILRERSGNFRKVRRPQLHPPQAPSGPFDWQVTPQSALIEYFRRDFNGMLEEEDLAISDGVVFNRKFGTYHPHEFPMDSDEAALRRRYAEARSRHDYLCSKFKGLLADPVRALFLTSESLSPAIESELRGHLKRYGVVRYDILAVDAPKRDSDAEWPSNWPIWDAALEPFSFNNSRRKFTMPSPDLVLGQLRRLRRHMVQMRF